MGLIEKTRKTYRDLGVSGVLKGVWVFFLQHSFLAPYFERAFGIVLHRKLIVAPVLGYWPQLREPRSFNEKLIHRKLFTDKDIFCTVSDKSSVRNYVKEQVGEEILNEVYHVTTDPETIPFEELPDSFVIKATHGAGWARIVEDKSEEDFDEIKQECGQWLEETFGEDTKEYWYGRIEPKLIVEKYINESGRKAPLDYKFFVFNDRVEYLHVDFGRFEHHTRTFFDRKWNSQDFALRFPVGHEIEKPPQLDEMIETAEHLAEGFGFVRVDLYNPSEGEVVFGEITLAPEAGQGDFRPKEWDFKFGSYW